MPQDSYSLSNHTSESDNTGYGNQSSRLNWRKARRPRVHEAFIDDKRPIGALSRPIARR